MNYPSDQIEFEERFSTEELCHEYLMELRWPEGFACSHCGSCQYWAKSRKRMACTKCHHEFSVMAGTLFAKSHLPLKIWFRAAWWVTNQKQGISALGLQRALGIGSYETAWSLLHKLRGAMVNPARDLLSGAVELDEISVGGRGVGHESRWKDKQLIHVAAEIDGPRTGRIRMALIPNAVALTLKESALKLIKPGSTLVTDGWTGYYQASSWGYLHKRYPNDKATNEQELLPRVHRVASLFKRWLKGTHHGRVDPKHLQAYADEFVFRFNRRTSLSRGLLFFRLLQNAVASKPRPHH